MLVFAVFTSLALLSIQFKHDVSHIVGIVQLEPEDDPALHRRPSVATLLKLKKKTAVQSSQLLTDMNGTDRWIRLKRDSRRR